MVTTPSKWTKGKCYITSSFFCFHVENREGHASSVCPLFVFYLNVILMNISTLDYDSSPRNSEYSKGYSIKSIN